jgi:hypothetical protein
LFGLIAATTETVFEYNIYSYKPLTAVNGAGMLYEENGPLADDTVRRDYDWKGTQNSHQVRSDAGAVLHSESFLADARVLTNFQLRDLFSTVESGKYLPLERSAKMVGLLG